jgi:hypothetical protein
VPQAAEAVWQQNESHYLRGTERSYLAARNVAVSAGAPVEVAADDGKALEAGRDYRLECPPPRSGAAGAEAPRSALARIPGGGVSDGGHVTASYNALADPAETPAACPRSEEALAAFREALAEVGRLARPAGAGLGGAFAARMRSDRRTASTRFKNGRLLADRLGELAAELEKALPGATPFLWADLVNPCSALRFPEDSPAAAAELIDPALRRRLVLLAALADLDEDGRERMARSTAFLAERGYRLAGFCGPRGASAARAWAEQFARVRAAPAPPAALSGARGECVGMVFDLREARALELEAFAEAAWRGAEPPPAAPPAAGP